MPKRLIFLFLLNVINLFLVNLFTVSPKVVSGNGNLGILFLVTGAILLFLFMKELWRELHSKHVYMKEIKKIFWGSVVALLLCSYLEVRFVLQLIAEFGGPPSESESRIYRFSWLNQYTNTFYLNAYTFVLFVSIVLLFFSFRVRMQKKANESRTY